MITNGSINLQKVDSPLDPVIYTLAAQGSRRGGNSMRSGSSASDVGPGIGRKIVLLRQNLISHPVTWVLQLLKNAKWRIIDVPQLQVTTGRDETIRLMDFGMDYHPSKVAERVKRPSKMALHSHAVPPPTLSTPFSADLSGVEWEHEGHHPRFQKGSVAPMPVLLTPVEEIPNPIDPLAHHRRRYDGQVRHLSNNRPSLHIPQLLSGLDQVKFIVPDAQSRAVSLGIDVVQDRLPPRAILPPLFQLGHDMHRER
ncbi:hypothetical protein BKA70DRAFT_1413474 [Coprinopsis sp. MPI-PUGE-AT-0042]|nr:hypothetical protein BKA70DRAFT_1413474 [Coprinopsis sp. MPI-PUGE-AT-0042]